MNARRIGGLIALVVLAAGIGWAVTRDNPSTDTVATDTVVSGDDAASAPESSTSGSDVQATSPPTSQLAPEVDLPNMGPHPELVGITGWQQSDIDSLDDLDGRVYAVQFWTFGCYNCKNTLPHLQALYAKYKDQGFEIVGVHSPEFDHEAVPENIANASEELGVTWPIALDPEKKSFRKWQEGGKRVWPRIFIIDQNGDIRLDHRGEGAYDEIDAAVGALLAQGDAAQGS